MGSLPQDPCRASRSPGRGRTVCLGCVWNVPADLWGKSCDLLLGQQPKDDWRSSSCWGKLPG